MKSKFVYILSFLFAAGGFLWPFWPLSVVGVVFAALMGRFIWAVLLGLLLDVAWGVPWGVLGFVYLPFTLLALLCALFYYLFAGYFLDRRPPHQI